MKSVKVNCYNKATERAMKKQLRDSKGKYARKNIGIYFMAICSILVIAYIGVSFNNIVNFLSGGDKVVVQAPAVSIDTAKKIIEGKKVEILDALKNCESKGIVTAINWEDYGTGKNRASFGSYMFKVGTIQKAKPELNDFQAIQLASDETLSRSLAENIIFSNSLGGISNWKNCAIKLKLFDKVNFVMELQDEINSQSVAMQ